MHLGVIRVQILQWFSEAKVFTFFGLHSKKFHAELIAFRANSIDDIPGVLAPITPALNHCNKNGREDKESTYL